MKITRINASGLKGKAFDHTLTKPNTVFIGANGSGKSSRLDAVQLALFGTHPSLGKTNESTIRISSGTELVVGASLSDGSIVRRTWFKSKSGTSCDVVGGIDKRITPLCLNPNEYFGLSDRERTKLVFKLCRTTTNFRNELVAQAKSIKLKDHDAGVEVIVNTVCASIGSFEAGMAGTSTEWLEQAAEFIKGQVSSCSAAAKRMSSTLAGLSELRALSSQPVNSAAERELAELNRQIANLDMEIRGLEAQHNEIARKLARKAELERQLAVPTAGIPLSEAQAVVNSLEREISGYITKTPQLKADLLRLQSERSERMREHERIAEQIRKQEKNAQLVAQARQTIDLGGENESAIKTVSERIESLEGLVRGQLSPLAPAWSEVGEAQNEKVKLEEKIKLLSRELEAVVSSLSEYDSVDECEHCHWKEKITDGLVQERKRIVSEIDSLKIGWEAAKKKEESAKAVASDLLAAHEQRKSDLQALSTAKLKAAELESKKKWANQVLEANSSVAFGTADALSNVAVEIADIDGSVAVAKGMLDDSLHTDQAHADRIGRLESARKTVNAIMQSEVLRERLRGELESLANVHEADVNKLSELRANRASLTARVPELTTQMRQALAARGEAATKLIAAEEALRVTREEKVWREVKKIVDEVQSKAVQDSVAPIIDAANTICSGLLPSPLVMVDGVIGRIGERKFISTDTFNKSDQMIAFSAVCVALAGASGCPLKLLLMDDLDNIQDDRLKVLIDRVATAIEHGIVTQMIGCSVRHQVAFQSDAVEVVAL